MIQTNHKLPDKPSELIRVALTDLELCEKDSRFKIGMGAWYVPSSTKPICHVCFAGAVMAMRLGYTQVGVSEIWKKVGHPEDFKKEISDKLHALDCFQSGKTDLGLVYMGLGEISFNRETEIVSYHENSSAFRNSMENLADELEKAGH